MAQQLREFTALAEDSRGLLVPMLAFIQTSLQFQWI